MLVLTRRKNESLVIGDGIEVKIISIKENYVRLGVVAPRGVKILRSELEDWDKPSKEIQDD